MMNRLFVWALAFTLASMPVLVSAQSPQIRATVLSKKNPAAAGGGGGCTPGSIFTATLIAATGGDQGTSYRQVVPITGGDNCTQVRVTFQAGAGSPFQTDHAAICIWSTTLANCTAAPVELKFAGASGFSILAAGTLVSDYASLSGLSATVRPVVIMDLTVAGSGSAAWLTAQAATNVLNGKAGATWNVQSPGTMDFSSSGEIAGFNKIEVQ